MLKELGKLGMYVGGCMCRNGEFSNAALGTACLYLIDKVVFASPLSVLPLSDAYHANIAFTLLFVFVF